VWGGEGVVMVTVAAFAYPPGTHKDGLGLLILASANCGNMLFLKNLTHAR